MACIRKTPNGKKWRVSVMMLGCRKTATFPIKAQAAAWATHIEKEIRDKYKRDAERPFKKPQGLMTEEDVVASAVHAQAMCGVYFLIKDTRVVYVGKSVDMYCRISEHRTKGRDFTHYAVIPCPPENLSELESRYILGFSPEGNRNRIGALIYAMSETELRQIQKQALKTQ